MIKSIQISVLAALFAVAGIAAAQTPAPTPGKADNTDNKVKATAPAATSDKTRAEVKADAKAAATMPGKSGEASSQDPKAAKMASKSSDKTRAEVKADAKADAKAAPATNKTGEPGVAVKK